MKKISVKTIAGLITVSVATTTAVGVTLAINHNASLDQSSSVNDVANLSNANLLAEAENQVKEAQTKVEEADKKIEEATKAKEEAQKEVDKANETIEKAKNAHEEALKEVKNARTEEERKTAEEKVKALEEEIKTAESLKKTAEAKVQTAIENATEAQKAKDEALNEFKIAEENKKKIEEQIKNETEEKKLEPQVVEEAKQVVKEEIKSNSTSTPATQSQATNKQPPKTMTEASSGSSRELTDEQWDMVQKALERDAKTRAEQEAEKAQKDAQEKADREAAAAKKALEEEQKRKEREAWEEDIRRQSEEVNKPYDPNVSYDKEYDFTGKPSVTEAKQELTESQRTVQSVGEIVSNNSTINIYKPDGVRNGEIWFIEFKVNLNNAEGFSGYMKAGNDAVIIEGRRSDYELPITVKAPTAKSGYKFVGWKKYTVTYTNSLNYKTTIDGYEAVYERA